MKVVGLIAVLLVCIDLVSFPQSGGVKPAQIGVLEGQVFITNSPGRGRTPAVGMVVMVQKIGCPRCLIGASTDQDGKYFVYLGNGRYRVLCQAPGGAKNLITSGQRREVRVSGPKTTEFNFDIDVPSSWVK